MNRLKEAQEMVVSWLDRSPASETISRAKDMDLRSYLPSWGQVRDTIPAQVRPSRSYDMPSLMIGMLVGVGIGVGVGMLVGTQSVRPMLMRARRDAQRALEKMEENLPSRLNVTRVEERT